MVNWFKFYPANFVEASYLWKPEIAGIYLRLLIHQFSNGAIPKDVKELCAIAGCDVGQWNLAWKKLCKKFEPTEDGFGYENPRMKQIRVEALSSYERRVEAARKSHESRSQNKQELQCNSNANSNALASASGSGSSSSSKLVTEVFDHYRAHHPKSRLGKTGRQKITARMNEGFSVSDLKLAIDGCHQSKFHCGENDRGQKYQSLELIFRNDAKTNEFIEMASSQNGSASCQPRTGRSSE